MTVLNLVFLLAGIGIGAMITLLVSWLECKYSYYMAIMECKYSYYMAKKAQFPKEKGE